MSDTQQSTPATTPADEKAAWVVAFETHMQEYDNTVLQHQRRQECLRALRQQARQVTVKALLRVIAGGTGDFQETLQDIGEMSLEDFIDQMSSDKTGEAEVAPAKPRKAKKTDEAPATAEKPAKPRKAKKTDEAESEGPKMPRKKGEKPAKAEKPEKPAKASKAKGEGGSRGKTSEVVDRIAAACLKAGKEGLSMAEIKEKVQVDTQYGVDNAMKSAKADGRVIQVGERGKARYVHPNFAA